MTKSAPTPVPVPTASTYSQSDVQIEMDLDAVWNVAKNKLPDLIEQLGDALSKIADAMNAIQVNWAGKSAKAADDLSDKWMQIAISLFGTNKRPEIGVLNRIAGGLQGAVLNMNFTEGALYDAWQKYYDQLIEYLNNSSSGDGSGNSSEQSEPISEV